MSSDQKQDAIIQAAIRRFAHFGVAKTTMSEIAADLSLSKASLYYYFPDKLNLYAAVFKHIADIGEKEGEEVVNQEKDPFRSINVFLEKRTEFIVKYHNILEYIKTFNPYDIPAELHPIFEDLHKREIRRIASILQKGISNKQLNISDVHKTATLFYEFLSGFRTANLLKQKGFMPGKPEFRSLLKKEQEFAAIFFKGLTVKNSD